ncbi:hypothetical protein LTR78_001805 [Recurvomyces mirabilis]|uniref:Uncharacterized protein n=1 Tax=Recurvomyces mirabilis TaxID=574656 RepID=A0AAE0WVB8_9PEZI|nr:hypothetical protein LTR78_001805 [Recurvomyces mirabilis]KAK5156755.1 hypothetical protein LTS14_004968 [Recurvomyces mirabilis]
MATDLCLRVLKFSHALGVRADNTIPWTHLQASDIFAVVRGKDTQIADGQLSLDVVQGTTVLETLNVAQYIDAAQQARRGAESHGVRLETEQLPIFGITKDALLALRYRHEPDGKVRQFATLVIKLTHTYLSQQRRIQLRFEDATQCRKLVTAFMQRGMEFQEQRPGTARTTQARPTTGHGPERLLTATSSSPYFDAEQTSRHLSATHQQADPQHDRQPDTVTQLHGEHISNSSTTKQSQDIASQDMGPPRYFSRDEVAAPREAIPERPSTAQIYTSFTTPSQQTLIKPQETVQRPSDPARERPSSTSHVSQLAAIREAVEEAATPPAAAHNISDMRMTTSMAHTEWSSGTPELTTLSSIRSETIGAPSSSARPSTAATTLPPEHYELPPPRVLPFKRPSSKSSSAGSKTAKSTKPAMVMPRLPVPAAAKSSVAVTSEIAAPQSSYKQVASTRPATSSPLKRTMDAASSTETELTSSPSKKPRTSHPTNPSDQILRKPSGMQQLLTNHKPLPSKSPNSTIPRLNSLADAPHEIDENPPHPPSKHRMTQNMPSKPPAQPTRHDTETSLEEYATQSLPDRQAALEDFMMRNLENPAFTKLCEDVENCWRRIALGL